MRMRTRTRTTTRTKKTKISENWRLQLGWKDKNRPEQPHRKPPFKPVPEPLVRPPVPPSVPEPLVPISSTPAVPSPVIPQPPAPSQPVSPVPPVNTEIPYTTQPRWCKPKPGCPEKWLRANAFSKVFLYPGAKVEISPKGGPDGKGIYRDAIPGESIWLYQNTAPFQQGNPSGSVFVDDTTELLFRQHFDYQQ